MSRPTSTREGLLDAAGRLVAREGVKGLTIANVAAEAGVSRGGVFYHFASKEELIRGMLGRLIATFERVLDEEAGSDPEPRGRWVRAWARAPLRMDERTSAAATALIAAIAHDPRLLDPLRHQIAGWRHQAEEGLDTTTARVVRLAAYGLWLNDLFALEALGPDERRAIIARLVALTRDAPNVE